MTENIISEHELIHNEWFDRESTTKQSAYHKKMNRWRPLFQGPIEVYPTNSERLPYEMLRQCFGGNS